MEGAILHGPVAPFLAYHSRMRAVHVPILGLLAALVSAASSDQPRMTADEVKRKLTGNWKLVKYETFVQAGTGTPPPPYDGGRLMYDEAGHMAAQLTRPG